MGKQLTVAPKAPRLFAAMARSSKKNSAAGGPGDGPMQWEGGLKEEGIGQPYKDRPYGIEKDKRHGGTQLWGDTPQMNVIGETLENALPPAENKESSIKERNAAQEYLEKTLLGGFSPESNDPYGKLSDESLAEFEKAFTPEGRMIQNNEISYPAYIKTMIQALNALQLQPPERTTTMQALLKETKGNKEIADVIMNVQSRGNPNLKNKELYADVLHTPLARETAMRLALGGKNKGTNSISLGVYPTALGILRSLSGTVEPKDVGTYNKIDSHSHPESGYPIPSGTDYRGNLWSNIYGLADGEIKKALMEVVTSTPTDINELAGATFFGGYLDKGQDPQWRKTEKTAVSPKLNRKKD